MTVLLLRLAAPLQSWGTGSRFSRRGTDRAPSKSGILGLLAAAQGRRRTDPLEELLGLRIAVRTEQAGTVERDFQTAMKPGERTSFSLSTRHHLADAVFLAAVQGDQALLEGLQSALRQPHFPLFLGRRSCPPVGRVEHGVRPGEAVDVLGSEPWHAAPWFQRAHKEPTALLDLAADCAPGIPGAELVRDEPVSFDPRHRQWEWRSVLHHPPVRVPNETYAGDRHDPMAVL
ncbi:MAG: type I-E CRISPR-associated protein Cas5/CasD [Pseudonocardia sp.]|nr:type I-E CRISPR-associated protein Cas5/CasD [Pseudonocardia sp.]